MSIVRQDFRSKLSGEKGESMNTVLEKIKKMGIVPVVVIENEKDADKLASWLKLAARSETIEEFQSKM